MDNTYVRELYVYTYTLKSQFLFVFCFGCASKQQDMVEIMMFLAGFQDCGVKRVKLQLFALPGAHCMCISNYIHLDVATSPLGLVFDNSTQAIGSYSDASPEAQSD